MIQTAMSGPQVWPLSATEKRWTPIVPVFDRLPAELVAIIFLLTTQVIAIKDRQRFLTALLLTCRRFNRIALNTPALWSGVVITFEECRRHVIDMYIARARAAPLEILLDFTWFPVYLPRMVVNSDLFRQLVQRCTRSSTQWKTLEVDLPIVRHDRSKPYAGILHQSLPNLRRLRLSSSHPQELPWVLPDGSMLRNLRELQIFDIVPDWGKVREFSQLEDIHVFNALAPRVTPHTTHYFLRSIASCQKLRSLCVQGINSRHRSQWRPGNTPSLQPVTMPRLDHLMLTQAAGGLVTSYMLSLINAPMIELVVVGSLSPNVTGSSPAELPLERLAVRSMLCYKDIAESLIWRCSDLLHLRLDASPLERLMESLPLCLSGTNPICPKLVALTTRHINPAAIQQIVQARARKIKEVNIAFEDIAWMSASGTEQSLQEYEMKEWVLMWLWANVSKVRLYGVEPDQVIVCIKGVDEVTRRKKAQILQPLCDFKWIPFA